LDVLCRLGGRNKIPAGQAVKHDCTDNNILPIDHGRPPEGGGNVDVVRKGRLKKILAPFTEGEEKGRKENMSYNLTEAMEKERKAGREKKAHLAEPLQL